MSGGASASAVDLKQVRACGEGPETAHLPILVWNAGIKLNDIDDCFYAILEGAKPTLSDQRSGYFGRLVFS